MSQRPNIDPAVVTTVEGGDVRWFILAKLEFDSGTKYLTSNPFKVIYAGQEWVSVAGLVNIEPVEETGDASAGLRFTLSGVPNGAIAETLQEEIQGRPVTIMLAVLDGSQLRVDEYFWKGRLDAPEIDYGRETCTITTACESAWADMARARLRLFNHAHQQLIDSTDFFYFGCESMEEQEIVVFSKEVMMI